MPLQTEIQLPDKPSALIRLAISDLAKCEANPGTYKIRMDRIHDPHAMSRRCLVCLAGAVMAQTFKADPTKSYSPVHFEPDKGHFLRNGPYAKLWALDDFRKGNVLEGLTVMRIARPASLPIAMHVGEYEANANEFKGRMLRMADEFEKAGI